ncbi:DNA-binding RFX-type winged-helix domain [Lasallia pustulata]|uniref:DNA-binding RFX-type winged-helix domain n=1 Tax=Lasallia pustulata TaxID=136370 RepID=A0A1W5CUN6_9LECA|nr:DNA-binding RFX-type winged-helix domain [Lasallia pustulata]
MAPPRLPHEVSVDGSPEQEAFFEALRAFHDQRGTPLDLGPRVNGKHIDLFKLFNLVMQRGGYDAVSSEKLAWRKVGQDFNLGQTNTAAYAFALKSVYYKNLAAYEIKTIHNREPPPREILENISAKGGDLLNRTVENFKPPQSRDNLANGQDSDASGDEERKTPKEEKMDIDDPGSAGGRVSRGLRQAPPQRVLFQPDLSSSRQTRHASGHLQSPQPVAATSAASYLNNPSSNPNSMSFSIAGYEPKPQMPLTLRGVITPGNNPALFKERQRISREARAGKLGTSAPSYKGMMLPGTGFDGPNIYVRTLLALRSGIPEEQDYALHHLVKISHERGDKYKFEAFPGLAEGLIEKVLEVSSLYYDVKWEISFDELESKREIHVLDGMNGTPDILQRIQQLQRLDTLDDLETEGFGQKLTKINEAGLVIRNMSLLDDNADYLSRQPSLRDFLSIALNLPHSSAVVELQHYALDIAEQLTKFWSLDVSDPLYTSLVAQLSSLDRSAILTSLRSLSRISMSLDSSPRLAGIPADTLRRICDWTLLDDEELVHASLDFLYQYTALPSNVELLLDALPLQPLIHHLVRLLLHSARPTTTPRLIRPAVPPTPATEIPALPLDLLELVLKSDEPERSSLWLRACFQEDPDADITQIALWQAYQARFAEFSTPLSALLPAAEFIKNVSSTFAGANAQVINGPNPKFIIKGIRPRHLPMDPKGRVYAKCLWIAPGDTKACGEFLLTPAQTWEHVVKTHLRVPVRDDGRYDLQPAHERRAYDCHWAGCRHFAASAGSDSAFEVGMHLKTHLPDSSPKAERRQVHNRSFSVSGTAELVEYGGG